MVRKKVNQCLRSIFTDSALCHFTWTGKGKADNIELRNCSSMACVQGR
jgi:hypothetical protein